MPSAYVYAGADGAAATFDGGLTPQIVNILTQRVSLPSANNSAGATCGVDQLSIFFFVNRAVDIPQTLNWHDLTNGEYAPAGEFVERSNAVRCDVSMGYEGGSTASAVQFPGDTSKNGFNAYGLATAGGIVLQTDNMGLVGNFDDVSINGQRDYTAVCHSTQPFSSNH